MYTSKMTMTTSCGEVEMKLGGTGTATIDWGDGSEVETQNLEPCADNWTREEFKTYSDKSAHTITITGENITYLGCPERLTALDVSKNTALMELWCQYNDLKELDVSRNTALAVLCCANNNLTALDVSKNTALVDLNCGDNYLTSLDVSRNTALIALHCGGNNLAALDVSQNTALLLLSCYNNELTALDVSRNAALEQLICGENNLTELDVSKNPALDRLSCGINSLTALDLSQNTALKVLFISYGKHTALEVSRNTALRELHCDFNLFSADALNAMFETLHTNTGPYCKVNIERNPGTDDCDTDIAEKKGWFVTPYKQKTLREIKGADKTVFTYDVLQEMREGKIDRKHPIFEILHNVKDILYRKGVYDAFAEFMQKLKTDAISLQSPDNAIRKVYKNFQTGTPQTWHLIDADEFHPIFEGDLEYTSRALQVEEWVANAKENVLQLIANSFLTSGPELGLRAKNSEGQLPFYRLWRDLTGDEKINRDNEKYFDKNYWNPFIKYIGTDFGDGDEEGDGNHAFETDSPLDGFFNIIANFEKNYDNPQKLFAILERLVNLRHQRGSFKHLFMIKKIARR